MTKLRQPNSIEDALLEMYAILGIENAASKISRTAAHMRRLSDPDHTSLPTIQQCMVLDAECVRAGHVPPMLELYSRWIASIAHEEGADEEALGDLFIEIASGIGKVANGLHEAQRPGSVNGIEISHCEATKLRRMLSVASRAIHRMDRALRKKQRNQKPTH